MSHESCLSEAQSALVDKRKPQAQDEEGDAAADGNQNAGKQSKAEACLSGNQDLGFRAI